MIIIIGYYYYDYDYGYYYYTHSTYNDFANTQTKVPPQVEVRGAIIVLKVPPSF